MSREGFIISAWLCFSKDRPHLRKPNSAEAGLETRENPKFRNSLEAC